MQTLKLKTALKTSVLSLAVLVLGAFYPAMAVAEDTTAPDTSTTPTTSETTPAPAPQQGPTKPTGAESKTYHYNSATGMWENDYYIWNPATNQTTPKNKPAYSYNPDTGMWDTTKWVYSPEQGKYVPNIVSVAQKPAGAPVVASQNTALNADGTNASANSETTNDSNDSHTSGNSNDKDKDGVKHNSKSNGIFDSFYDASISNNIDSQAHSGNVDVSRNTMAANAVSGMANATVNILNLLQSSWGVLGSNNFVTFVSDILGNVVGDLFLDPGSAPQAASTSPSNLDVNVQNNGQINNNVTVDAGSGNVNASQNTIVGDATTGDANAVANVVNMINSLIGSGQSFVGTINVQGNLNGDILMPPEWLNTLLGSNVPTATLDSSTIDNSDLNANLTDIQSINNNVNLAANSGNANVSQNTTAGNVTTGDTNTNLTVLNLTGRQVIGSNALLVFVNVLGKWVGAIVNAPAGSTAAALGNGITQNSTLAQDTDINATSNNQINNNIDLNAHSGDATVTQNTQAGNTRTGDATASANLLNLTNSAFSFSNWFGVLFINVFGTWNGSFGIDTAAGNLPSTGASVNPGVAAASDKIRVFRFVPTGTGKFKPVPVTSTADIEQPDNHQSAVLASTGNNSNNHPANASQSHVGASKSWFVPVFGSLIGSALLGTERVLTLRDRRRASVPKHVAYHLS